MWAGEKLCHPQSWGYTVLSLHILSSLSGLQGQVARKKEKAFERLWDVAKAPSALPSNFVKSGIYMGQKQKFAATYWPMSVSGEMNIFRLQGEVEMSGEEGKGKALPLNLHNENVS